MLPVVSFLLLDKSRERIKQALKNSQNTPVIQLYRAVHDQETLGFKVELVGEPSVVAEGIDSGQDGITEQQDAGEHEEMEEKEYKEEDEEKEDYNDELEEDERKKETDNDEVADEDMYYGAMVSRWELADDSVTGFLGFVVSIPLHGIYFSELLEIAGDSDELAIKPPNAAFILINASCPGPLVMFFRSNIICFCDILY